MRYKIDLHTHSIISHDGGITADQYSQLLEKGVLDVIAITDHNETKFALDLVKKFGEKIIVGEEISTREGEMIGLFLKKTIPGNFTALETAKLIHEQGGIVYIPHPFEIFRQGLKRDVLQRIVSDIDIIEVFNARGKWRGKSGQALAFAKKYDKAMAAAGDSHCHQGMGSSYTIISEIPTNKTLINLLAKGELNKQFAPVYTYLCPAINKIKHKFFIYVR
ncbi:PHP domain-containing protein [Patescibacteria group bacterium]|nr:PHP domain-containing protein [Patescibacteria group bacterium]MBU4099111.1 PHP domain-containing protein [Patescibacteria group bacterium]